MTGIRNDTWVRCGAAAGSAAVLLFVVGAFLAGTPPDFDLSGREVAAYFAEDRTRIQVGSAFFAAAVPFFVWFLAAVAWLARAGPERARRAGAVAFGCGLIAFTLFLADVAALAVGALRPDNMVAAPELAQALLDFSFLAFGMASFLMAGLFAALAVLVLRDRMLWPRWLGLLAVIVAPATALRIGTLFTTEGPFAADGVLGLYVPVSALGAWILLASISLTRRLAGISEPSRVIAPPSG